MTSYANYHATRFSHDNRRSVLWDTLTRHVFQAYVPRDGAILELGAGYCDFINSIEASEKYALDLWPGMVDFAAPGVRTIVGDLSRMSEVPDGSLDVIFASNLFEHVTQDALRACVASAKLKLKPGGRLIAVQPNYKFAYREYFDDYTHIAVWSDVSLGDFFQAEGLEIEKVVPRFLPLTVKSGLPVHPLLIRAYLASPIRPLGKQMMLVARNRAKGASA
ncbi:class I SAM-dependent methyltransferase [Microvirga sp. 2MCAF38]|uniref:class I SAM-dependent methyltransferase n=1 Tax=Microvirga sp. 2MCAF38 TaxID=3232989 RepID=UPI003F9BCF3C